MARMAALLISGSLALLAAAAAQAETIPNTTLTAPARQVAVPTAPVAHPTLTTPAGSTGNTAAAPANTPPASPEHQMRTLAECTSRIPANFSQKLHECETCVSRPVPYVYWEEYPAGNRCARDVGIYHP